MVGDMAAARDWPNAGHVRGVPRGGGGGGVLAPARRTAAIRVTRRRRAPVATVVATARAGTSARACVRVPASVVRACRGGKKRPVIRSVLTGSQP